MKEAEILRLSSLISLVLLTLHLTDDVVRGMFPTGIALFYAAIASGVLLCGILLLAEQRSNLLLMLLISIVAVAMPLLHMSGAGVFSSAKSSGGFFFVWTLVALGAIGTCSFMLSLRGLWNLQASRRRL